MDNYTFKSSYGDYSFSAKQIEANNYLTSEERDIMLGLAKYQSSKPVITPKEVAVTSYKVEQDYRGRKSLTKTPVAYSFEADLSDKRWYETVQEFAVRKAKEFERKNTVKVKEVTRENVNVERSTYSDGTQITNFDRTTRYFI